MKQSAVSTPLHQNHLSFFLIQQLKKIRSIENPIRSIGSIDMNKPTGEVFQTCQRVRKIMISGRQEYTNSGSRSSQMYYLQPAALLDMTGYRWSNHAQR